MLSASEMCENWNLLLLTLPSNRVGGVSGLQGPAAKRPTFMERTIAASHKPRRWLERQYSRIGLTSFGLEFQLPLVSRAYAKWPCRSSSDSPWLFSCSVE